MLESEASLYGVQVNGLASVRWCNPKGDNALQEDMIYDITYLTAIG
jgi:hypothetical protein